MWSDDDGYIFTTAADMDDKEFVSATVLKVYSPLGSSGTLDLSADI